MKINPTQIEHYLNPMSSVHLSRYWERRWWWSVNVTVCPAPALYGPAGKACKTWGRSPWTWRPSTCLPLKWFTGPWGHASSWYPKTLTSGPWGRTSWSTCRAPRTSVPRMKSRALLAHRTGETATSQRCVWLWVCMRKRGIFAGNGSSLLSDLSAWLISVADPRSWQIGNNQSWMSAHPGCWL